jgi:hypothetical protein
MDFQGFQMSLLFLSINNSVDKVMSSTRSASLPGVVSTAAVAVGSRVTVGAGATLKRGVVAFVGETEVT